MKHHLVRTSPKGPGQDFIGTCTLCGRQNLTWDAIKQDCENVRGLSQGDALAEFIKGSSAHTATNPKAP
jgi:hypothetical protein